MRNAHLSPKHHTDQTSYCICSRLGKDGRDSHQPSYLDPDLETNKFSFIVLHNVINLLVASFMKIKLFSYLEADI